MHIVLIRHGRPHLAVPKRIAGSELTEWITRYNEAGIGPLFSLPSQTIALSSSTSCIVTSNLRRSIASAQALRPGCTLITESIFREAALPSPRSCRLRLSPQVWGVAMRMAWFLGWSPNVESLQMARTRAKDAAIRLCQLAEQQDSVLLVGHAIFNRLLGTALRRTGWLGPRFPSGGYWRAAVYHK